MKKACCLLGLTIFPKISGNGNFRACTVKIIKKSWFFIFKVKAIFWQFPIILHTPMIKSDILKKQRIKKILRFFSNFRQNYVQQYYRNFRKFPGNPLRSHYNSNFVNRQTCEHITKYQDELSRAFSETLLSNSTKTTGCKKNSLCKYSGVTRTRETQCQSFHEIRQLILFRSRATRC